MVENITFLLSLYWYLYYLPSSSSSYSLNSLGIMIMKQRHIMLVSIGHIILNKHVRWTNALFDPDERVNFIVFRSIFRWLILFSPIQKEHELFLLKSYFRSWGELYQRHKFYFCNFIIDKSIEILDRQWDKL